MKYNYDRYLLILNYSLFFLLINSIYFYPQTNQFSSNQAGICFRVDDNKSITQYTEYSDVFNKYNLPFTFALNLGKDQITTEYVEMIKDLQSHGHEMMDHTPWHSTYWFSTKLGTEYYINHPESMIFMETILSSTIKM